jgi:elongation factor 1-beta
MAQAVVTIKIMPESPSEDLGAIRVEAEKAINAFVGENGEKRAVEEPIAFGLKALKITFIMDEAKGSTEPLELSVAKIPGVNSVDVIDVRRAVG